MIDLEIVDGITAIDKSYMTKYTNKILNAIFPIGSTYITQTNTDPNTILGIGTWERVKGKVLVGLDENDDSFNRIGKEGGEKTHKLTQQELPRFTPKTTNEFYALIPGGGSQEFGDGNARSERVDFNTIGGDQPHNNLQPYHVVGYMWIRIQ